MPTPEQGGKALGFAHPPNPLQRCYSGDTHARDGVSGEIGAARVAVERGETAAVVIFGTMGELRVGAQTFRD